MNYQSILMFNNQIDLTYNIIRDTFDFEYNNKNYQDNLKIVNFGNITNDMYIHIIELTKNTFSYILQLMKQNNNKIADANKYINKFTSKIYICKIRINVLSEIVESIDLTLNTCFKIKSFLEKLLYKYNYHIIHHYLYNYSLLIQKIKATQYQASKLIAESCVFLNIASNDAKEILELFPLDESEKENLELLDLEQFNIYHGVTDKTFSSVTNIIQLMNDMM
jgi:hypothetical protein